MYILDKVTENAITNLASMIEALAEIVGKIGSMSVRNEVDLI